MVDESERDSKIDDAIDRWHAAPEDECEGSLHDYLGWTWEEYAAYVESRELPPQREGAL